MNAALLRVPCLTWYANMTGKPGGENIVKRGKISFTRTYRLVKHVCPASGTESEGSTLAQYCSFSAASGKPGDGTAPTATTGGRSGQN